jgi:DNA-binding Lrp family transcriptional regulator
MGAIIGEQSPRRIAKYRDAKDYLQAMTKRDDITERILRELSRDGRISNLDLAGRVGLSPSACLRRVQELERSGVIAGYRAVLSAQGRGIGFVAYVGVGLSEHTKTAQEGFERTISRAPEVVECHNITGTIEYLLRVECADLAAYKRFHTEVLGTVPHVRSITSYVVMGSPKDRRA